VDYESCIEHGAEMLAGLPISSARDLLLVWKRRTSGFESAVRRALDISFEARSDTQLTACKA
jgi:hypothetical protein